MVEATIIECVGGPHDGARFPSTLYDRHLWVRGESYRPRATRSRRGGAVLYRLLSIRKMDGERVLRYQHAPHDLACEGCGAVTEEAKRDTCGLCGGRLSGVT